MGKKNNNKKKAPGAATAAADDDDWDAINEGAVEKVRPLPLFLVSRLCPELG